MNSYKVYGSKDSSNVYNTNSNNRYTYSNNIIKAAKSNRSKLIQFKVKEDIYNSINEKADTENMSVNLYTRKMIMEGIHGHTGLTPEILIRLAGIYNMLELPTDRWNDTMRKEYSKEMERLYNELFQQ